jgi:hypothetical protein
VDVVAIDTPHVVRFEPVGPFEPGICIAQYHVAISRPVWAISSRIMFQHRAIVPRTWVRIARQSAVSAVHLISSNRVREYACI